MVMIEFVCSGNHGRSPMAETIARHYVSSLGIEDKIKIISSGSHVEDGVDETKESAYKRETGYRTRVLGEIGLTYEGNVKQTVALDDVDVIFAMKEKNLLIVREIYANNEHKPKIMLLCENGIKDPFRGTEMDYRKARNEIIVAVHERIDEIVREYKFK